MTRPTKNTNKIPSFHYVEHEEFLYEELKREAKEKGHIILFESAKILNVRGTEFISVSKEDIASFKKAVQDAEQAKAKQDVYLNAITVTGQGTGTKTLTLSYAGGKEDVSVSLEDLDTIAVQYDDTELRNEINTIKNTTIPAIENRVSALESKKPLVWNDYHEIA